MKIFLSYGHDSNVPLIKKIKEYLSKDDNGKLRHDVWIDTSEIKAGKNWRNCITEGIMSSDVVLAGLSKHSTRNPGVCRDEINISIGVKGGNIKTILLEPVDVVAPPAMLSHIQWLDMSDWKEHINEGFDSIYFQKKFREIVELVETPENERFNGEITKLKEVFEPISSIGRIKSLTQKEMYGRKWLYDKIREWDKIPEQRIFWIMAGPGFGKSMFAANLHLQYNAHIPAVQFVEWGKPDHSNPCCILKNLAFQLAVRFPEYRKFVLQLPEVVDNKLCNKNEHELFDLLFCESTWLKIDGSLENIWILIDALDEANDEYDNKIAQTLARHINRMPHWIRFIITSRNDSKVRLPLQQYNPQVLDLDRFITNKNKEDMIEFLKGELSDFSPTVEQCLKIVEKSEGVFLYLQLTTEELNIGLYSLDKLEDLPNGINDYYYNLFTRIFQKNHQFYQEQVVPVLQIILSSTQAMDVQLLQFCSDLESETNFYKVLDSLEHILRIQEGRYVFFHNSIQNWLTDHSKSGQFFISKNDGKRKISCKFVDWLGAGNAALDKSWENYKYGFEDCLQYNITLPYRIPKERAIILLTTTCPSGSYGLGGILRFYDECMTSIHLYIDRLLEQHNDDFLLSFFISLFEATKDLYIEIGIVSKVTRAFGYSEVPINREAIWKAVKYSAFIGAMGKHIANSTILCPYKTYAIITQIIAVLAFYDRRVGEIHSGSLSDLGDFTAYELDEVVSLLKQNKTSSVSERVHYDDGELYTNALVQLNPSLYPNHMNY